MATPRPSTARSTADDGLGFAGAGDGGGGSATKLLLLTVEVVPVEDVSETLSSMLATALATLAGPRDTADAVWLATAEESPSEEIVSRLLDDLVSDWVCVDVTPPVRPVDPELPLMATGLEIAVDDAGPVLPVLVAVDEECTSPELPDWASGVSETLVSPPFPPFALPTPVELPPRVAAAADGPSRATAAAATPVTPAKHSPPATRDL